MSGLIEITGAAIIVAIVFCHSTARNWLTKTKPFHRNLGITLIALMFAGQALNESRKMFPFVRWAMYTEIYDDPVVTNGKFRALHADGQMTWVNPTRHYPSLSRNNHDRVDLAISKIQKGELSKYVSQLFDEYMSALGTRHSQSYPGNPVVEIQALLQTAKNRDNHVGTVNEVVRKLPIREQGLVGIVSVDE